MTKMTKPILKWVGGKSKILDNLLDKFPKQIINYHEPFVGGGSVLIEMLKRLCNGNIMVEGEIYTSDINPDLIGLYKNLQLIPEIVYSEISELIAEYNSCPDKKTGNRNALTKEDALKCKEDYYYWIRSQFNKMEDKTTTHASSMFIFLNKTCFRGLFREGPHGFNVPFGNYKNPEITNRADMIELGILLQPVKFECCSYVEALKKVDKNDFVYNGPTLCLGEKGGFVTYTAEGFDHEVFFEAIKNIKGKFLLSNSNMEYVREKMKEYNIEEIECRRAIHSKNPGTMTTELMIQNTVPNRH